MSDCLTPVDEYPATFVGGPKDGMITQFADLVADYIKKFVEAFERKMGEAKDAQDAPQPPQIAAEAEG